MAKQRVINTRFWSDPFVVDELNPLDRYLFLYLLTNEKTNIVGAYELSLRTMSNETGIEKEELVRMLKRLESRVVYVLGWVVFKKSIKHQNYNSPKIQSAIARELREIPEDVLKYIELPVNLGNLLFDLYGIDMVSHLTKPNLTKVTKVTKPNLTKDTGEKTPAVDKQPSKKINEMFDFWEITVGQKINSNIKSNRFAVNNLLKKFGEEKLQQLIVGVAKAQLDQYAPRISDFRSLQSKVDDLITWGKRVNATKQERASVVL